VRTGPDQVSVGDPAAINVIYNANAKFLKVRPGLMIKPCG
jgi:hypothetical protein